MDRHNNRSTYILGRIPTDLVFFHVFFCFIKLVFLVIGLLAVLHLDSFLQAVNHCILSDLLNVKRDGLSARKELSLHRSCSIRPIELDRKMYDLQSMSMSMLHSRNEQKPISCFDG